MHFLAGLGFVRKMKTTASYLERLDGTSLDLELVVGVDFGTLQGQKTSYEVGYDADSVGK